MRLSRLRAGSAGAALLHLHGGGWTSGGFETHEGLCRRLAACGEIDVFVLETPLAPEAPFPLPLEAALAAFRALRSSARELGLDPARLALGGDSSGGGLAAAAALDLARSGEAPARLLLLCPILDPHGERPSRRDFREGWFVDPEVFRSDLEAYAAGVAPDDPRLAPLRAQTLRGLPAAEIHVAEFDPFRDEGEAFAARLRAEAGDARLERHAGQIHYFYALTDAIPAADRAVRELAGRFGRALRGADDPRPAPP